MGPDAKPKHGGRVKRASAVVRAWDGPNSRIAFEMDLDQMPWGPFEALGKKVMVLIPEDADQPVDTVDDENEDGGASDIERALRHVEHAAEKCAEFAQLGNGSDQLWSRSLETWEWLRDYLTSRWMELKEQAPARTPEEGSGIDRPLPGMPGAAATLEVAANALRQTPLASWRDVVGGAFNPDAPTREEAIQTLLGVARLLSQAATPEAAPEKGVPEAVEQARSDPGPEPAGESERGPSRRDPEPEGHTRNPEGGGDLSYDYAAGYDEGYQKGRRVGRALGNRDRSGSRG